jgi:hypothetical protein
MDLSPSNLTCLRTSQYASHCVSTASNIVPWALVALLCAAAASAADDCSCQQGGTGNANATLVSAVVTLCTTNADKDRNTQLEIWINKVGDKEVAYRDLGRTEKLANGSSKVFDLPTKSNAMTRSEIQGSWLQLRITPIGHDSWRFKAKTVLTFTDGTTYQKCFDETALDRDARTGIYHLD